jgi:hypothetical protein
MVDNILFFFKKKLFLTSFVGVDPSSMREKLEKIICRLDDDYKLAFGFMF